MVDEKEAAEFRKNTMVNEYSPYIMNPRMMYTRHQKCACNLLANVI